MCTVDDIALEEVTRKAKLPLPGVDSGMEEKKRLLYEESIHNESRLIYSKYIKLSQLGDLEALKRALFYAWYQLAEPCWLTGISELPDTETTIAINHLERALDQGLNDKELSYMLPYYMTVCSYYLERFYPLPNIQSASALNSDDAREIARSSNIDWEKRGEMGAYWG